MTKKLIIFLILVGTFCYCKNHTSDTNFRLKNGDLIFQVSEESDFTKAIHNSTGNNRNLSFSHVGIIYLHNDSIFVIDAVPGDGVRKIRLDDFLNESSKSKEGNPLVCIYRYKDIEATKDAVQNAIKYIGYNYDSVFLQNNNAFYCSELVYECFVKDDKHLFETVPMNFKDKAGNFDPFWIEYYRKLDVPIPQDCSGTNPNQLSEDKNLYEVFRYF
ncbi:MAG: YiiX/YebB-like N1pC/P60 family cysteine hydrolase [Bacteroidales bacterium]